VWVRAGRVSTTGVTWWSFGDLRKAWKGSSTNAQRRRPHATRGDGGEGHVFKPAAPWSSRPPPCCIPLTACGARGLRPALRACAAGVASSHLAAQRCVMARPARGAAWRAAGRRGHSARRAGGHRGHGMRRAREAVAEGCTASGYRRGHGMRRARAAIAEGGAANVRGRRGEVAASAEGGVGTGRGERAAVAGTGCGESARLVRRSARRRWVSFGAERCLSMGLPAPPRRRGWQRGAGELQGGKLLQLARVPGQPALVVVGRPH